MTRKALARRIAQVLCNEPATRRGAGATPTRRAARILAGCFVARRSKTTAGILAPRTQPKFAAELLYEPQTLGTSLTVPIALLDLARKWNRCHHGTEGWQLERLGRTGKVYQKARSARARES